MQPTSSPDGDGAEQPLQQSPQGCPITSGCIPTLQHGMWEGNLFLPRTQQLLSCPHAAGPCRMPAPQPRSSVTPTSVRRLGAAHPNGWGWGCPSLPPHLSAGSGPLNPRSLPPNPRSPAAPHRRPSRPLPADVRPSVRSSLPAPRSHIRTAAPRRAGPKSQRSGTAKPQSGAGRASGPAPQTRGRPGAPEDGNLTPRMPLPARFPPAGASPRPRRPPLTCPALPPSRRSPPRSPAGRWTWPRSRGFPSARFSPCGAGFAAEPRAEPRAAPRPASPRAAAAPEPPPPAPPPPHSTTAAGSAPPPPLLATAPPTSRPSRAIIGFS